jgi:hypothetical protein
MGYNAQSNVIIRHFGHLVSGRMAKSDTFKSIQKEGIKETAKCLVSM